MQKITTFIWFDNNAQEAIDFYMSIFKQAKITRAAYNPPGSPGPENALLVASIQLDGQEFTFMNGGPGHPLTDAISLTINCVSQEEVDYYWNKLGEGGDEKAQRCGWLKDKFGLSWQIIPEALPRLLSSKESGKAQKAMHAMMQMKKIDIEKLEQAYNS